MPWILLFIQASLRSYHKYYINIMYMTKMITSMGYGELLHNRHIPSSSALDRNPNNIISCGRENKRLTYLNYLSMAPPSQLLWVVTNGVAGKGFEPHTSMKPMEFHQKAHLQGNFLKVLLIFKIISPSLKGRNKMVNMQEIF